MLQKAANDIDDKMKDDVTFTSRNSINEMIFLSTPDRPRLS